MNHEGRKDICKNTYYSIHFICLPICLFPNVFLVKEDDEHTVNILNMCTQTL